MKLSARELTMIAIFAAITAVMAQIAVPLPFTPIPISFGMVAIYISGIMLEPRHAVYSQITYLILGALGLPVFANFMGGLGALFGPTGGCLMAYPFMAALISHTLNSPKRLTAERERGKLRLYVRTSVALVIAICLAYFGGALWLTVTVTHSFYASLTLVCFPFIPLDIVKIALTVFAMLPLRARLISANMILLSR